MKRWMSVAAFFISFTSYSQTVAEKISAAITKLEVDSQCKHAMLSMYIIDKNGKIIFDKNSQTGLAPASCQKVITATTAFELLGKDYTYKTNLGYGGIISADTLKGNIYIVGSGDPTLGSWRYPSTTESVVVSAFLKAINAVGIKQVKGNVLGDDRIWGTQRIPNGWIWQDIGNYYGAGAAGLNWRENQYDLVLQSGDKIGESINIIRKKPPYFPGINLINEVTAAEKGSGDNTYIYLAPDAETGFIRGTIPVNENAFVVSGSMPDGGKFLAATISQYLGFRKADVNHKYLKEKINWGKPDKIFYTHTSPPLDSIMYWFLKKSINLYGEALLKTIAYEKTKFGYTDTGINVIKNFWSSRGIDRASLKIFDGSGLSPANRITTNALVTVLQYAKKQNWFSSFYFSLPEINGIKMKDGYINGVRSYSGYVKSTSGEEYIFSFIVNNFDGSAAAIREKMWKVLDLLK